MLRNRSENLRSVYILLFLTISFFFLEYQDPQKYALLFGFERDAVLGGDLWRLVSYQFTQAAHGWMAFPPPVVLFFTLLLLYLMGTAVEEDWGTARFLALFVVSSVVSAFVAALFGTPLLGSYFVNFTLLFVYAAMYPLQTFYVLGIVPIRVRWLAYIAAALLLVGIGAGVMTNLAVLAGGVTGLIFYAISRGSLKRRLMKRPVREPEPEPEPFRADLSAVRNAARAASMRKALETESAEDVQRLLGECEREIVAGVNICPPADFKPNAEDGYCVKCEGFPECAVRSMKGVRLAPKSSASVSMSLEREPSA